MEKKLSVNNLRISFRTNGGKVQAVRGISFDIAKGETLAIVGESGSGKSVTARAVLGILAPNAIVESGEIIYDGQDLLKINEDDFHAIRGDKIAMIFQDPMSSLNPIMRVGKQLTEAMLLKGVANQRASRKTFNTTLKYLLEFMNLAEGAEKNSAEATANAERCGNFDKFEYKHTAMELAYNMARNAADEAISEIDYLLFTIEKNAVGDIVRSVKSIIKLTEMSKNDYVLTDTAGEELSQELQNVFADVKTSKEYARLTPILNGIRELLASALTKQMPNFFAMGYYLTFAEQPLPDMPLTQLNDFLRKYLDDNFMLDFIAHAKRGIEYSYQRSQKCKAEVAKKLVESIDYIVANIDDKALIKPLVKELIAAVDESIDKLEIIKDSTAYTFHSSINDAVNFYYSAKSSNIKQQKKFEKESARFNKLVEKGAKPDWEVAPASIVDLELAKAKIVEIITRLAENYSKERKMPDYDQATIAMIDYLKSCASGVVNKITRSMAKNRALKLLEEVGIPEPRRRYHQYPFEFSGGMRQRIVIAIALAANPDILICDEPTTALDVTIQSQILELINALKEERKLSIMFITHDLGVVANMADRVAVMYAGKIVEYGTDEDIFYNPKHPYTWALLSSMPDLETKEKLEAIPGTPPNMIYPPKGDAFAARNKYAMQIDFEEEPPMVQISDTHYAATWLLHPDAPKVNPPQIITARVKRYQKEAKRSGGK